MRVMRYNLQHLEKILISQFKLRLFLFALYKFRLLNLCQLIASTLFPPPTTTNPQATSTFPMPTKRATTIARE
jgi:hypothetical protein